MNGVLFFSHYFIWHYTRAYADMAALYLNFMWYTAHLFSMPLLLRTLFSPWKRISAGHRKFDLQDWAEALTFNILSRITGAIIRGVLLLLGLLCFVFLTIGFVALLILWFFLPFLMVYAPLYGVSLFV